MSPFYNKIYITSFFLNKIIHKVLVIFFFCCEVDTGKFPMEIHV